MIEAQGRANRLHEALRPFAEAVISAEEHLGVLESSGSNMLISAGHFQHMIKHPLIFAWMEAVRRIYQNRQTERLAK